MNDDRESGSDSAPGQPRRKKLPHEPPPWVPSGSVWFLTINCDPAGKPQLCEPDGSGAQSGPILCSARFYHEMNEPRWFIHCLMLMPDHLHAILSFPSGVSIRRTVSAWKGFVKRKHGIVWQGDFFDHRLRNDRERNEKLEYIRMNPVRKGYCDFPKDWPNVISFDPRSGEELFG